MNSKNDSARFPSNRSIAQIKKDAKRLKKEQGIDLTTAQNILSKKNGLNMPFSKAINCLSTQRQSSIKSEDNSADQQNRNQGTQGTNPRYDKVHGNRSKQLSRVIMLVEKRMFTDNDLEINKLERLSAKTAFKLGLFDPKDKGDEWKLRTLDLIRFQKPIKGGVSNHSGALLRIRSVIPKKGALVLGFWIGSKEYDFPMSNENSDDEVYDYSMDYNPSNWGD